MSETDLWKRIKSVSENVGISDDNLRQMRSQKRISERLVAPLYMELAPDNVPALLRDLHSLSQKQ